MGTENYMPRHSLLGTTRMKELFLSGLGSNELEAAAIPSFRASHFIPAVSMYHFRRQ